MGIVSEVERLRSLGKLMGDESTLEHFAPTKVVTRGRNRLVGKGAGRALMSFNIVGLVFWAEFMVWLRNSVQRAAAKDIWVGTVASYAPLYEFGLFEEPTSNPEGRRLTGGKTRAEGRSHAPFFHPAVFAMMAGLKEKGGGGGGILSGSARSGIYKGSRRISDAKSLVNGNFAQRIARRASGQATSAFTLGTLVDPDRNVFETLGKELVRRARKNVEAQDLVDTGALRDSIVMAPTFNEMQLKSAKRIEAALEKHGYGHLTANRIDIEIR